MVAIQLPESKRSNIFYDEYVMQILAWQEVSVKKMENLVVYHKFLNPKSR
jgi:hypothetical protein